MWRKTQGYNWHWQVGVLALPSVQALLNLTWMAPSVQPRGPGCGLAIGFGGTWLEPFGKKDFLGLSEF